MGYLVAPLGLASSTSFVQIAPFSRVVSRLPFSGYWFIWSIRFDSPQMYTMSGLYLNKFKIENCGFRTDAARLPVPRQHTVVQ